MADGHDAEPVGETIGFFKKPSPPSSVDVDDASSVSTGFNADFVLECAAGFQTERDELSSSSTNRSQRQSVKDELSTSSNNRSQRQRRNLPTLEEFPGSVTRPATYVSSNSSHRSPSGHPGRVVDDDGLDKEKVKSLNNTASGYALRGDERRALKTYKQALRLTRIEIARINHQMQLCKDKPSNIRATIHILLHDEWTEVALIIAEIRTMMAIIYERIGDYDKAISCCKEARDIHERQSQFDEKHMYEGSMAKEKAQRMSHMAVKMEQAKSTFSLRRRLHKDVIHYHRKISMSQEPAVKEELYKTLFEKITAALELELESLGQNHPQVADTMTFLAKVHLERDDVGKALDSMTQAVSIAEVSLGTSHPRTGEKYHEVAQLYEVARRDKEDVKKAILFHEKAIASFKNSNMDEPRKIGSILNDVAVLHIRLKEYDRAVHKLSDALACYGTSSVDDEKEVSVDTVQVWRNLAECYVKRKAWESATMAFKSALEVQRDARKLFDATRSGLDSLPRLIQDESIAETLNRLGKSYAEQKRYQSAHKVLLEALVLFRSPHEKLQTPEAQDNVASVLFGLAKVKEGEEKENEAIRLYTESLQLRRSSDKQRPKDKKRNHVHCAMCMAGIGSVRMNQQHYGLAFKIFNDALRSSRRQNLPDRHPIMQMLGEKSRLAARKMGDPSEGVLDTTLEVNDYEQSNTFKDKHNLASCYRIASSMENKAHNLESKGDIKGAIDSMRTVLELRRAHVRKKGEAKRDTSTSKEKLADSLETYARLVQMTGAAQLAAASLHEAQALYKACGKATNDENVRQTQSEWRLRRQ